MSTEDEDLHSSSNIIGIDGDDYDDEDCDVETELGVSNDASASDKKSDQDEYQEMHELAQTETRRIKYIRRIVVSIILCVGAALSAFTYIVLKNQNEADSKDAFQQFASTIEENWKFRISTIFSASRALSRGITTSAFTTSTEQKFPYFAVPAWEAKAFESRFQAGFETVTYAPIMSNREKWLNFTRHTRQWLDESKFIYDDLEPGKDRSSEPPTPPLPDVVWDYDNDKNDGSLVERNKNGIMVASLHVSPPPLPSVEIYQNINMFSNPDYRDVSNACVKLKDAVFSSFSSVLIDITDQLIGVEAHQEAHLYGRDRYLYPHSIAAQPVYRGLSAQADDVVAYIYSVVAWDRYLHNLLPADVVGIIVVLRNSCGQAVTYELQGEEAVVLATADIHDPAFDDQAVTVDFSENYFDPTLTSQVEGHCQVFLDVYPSVNFEDSYNGWLPAALTGMVASLFLFMAACFFLYDWFVQSRNEKVVGVAARSNAIVSSLFPSKIKERLMEDQLKKKKNKKKSSTNSRNNRGGGATSTASKLASRLGYANNLRGFLSNREELLASETAEHLKSPPIADYYAETTILFADIAGFTAWSSSREPGQVFTLLETIYHQFDAIAKRRKVFKVETIGDCYVAVCGLPDPRKDHAVVMCRFAKEAMHATWYLTRELTATLGPDTSDLTMRIGIHSGPVTAGVLRGEKGRFQLFGDSMNTASRMESNGCRSRIQISQQTADLLAAGGKDGWFKPRADKIVAKGKGELQTYWLNLSDGSETSSTMTNDSLKSEDTKAKKTRGKSIKVDGYEYAQLIAWNVEMLCPLLKKLVASRLKRKKLRRSRVGDISVEFENEVESKGRMLIDEVCDVISFNDTPLEEIGDSYEIKLKPEVTGQLKSYVSKIAALYNNNLHFHSFDHASHVTLSIQKLLARIVAPETNRGKGGVEQSADIPEDGSQGISHPLTQLACVLSGLIHDVDHPGVPNAQLIKEDSPLAARYEDRSIAEQNSVDVAWNLLMSHEFEDLRKVIYTDGSERQHFRSVLVNSVMATDIMDPDLKKERNLRWDKAFSGFSADNPKEARDRKSTIVLEHLIQASDVSHTMQHWHVYVKWNSKLFAELYSAWKEGRSEKNPAEFWYTGEIGFFEFYIIPLAKKLKECGVFGVSSDEYLSYAKQNLAEWKSKGKELVEDMIRNADSSEMEESVRRRDYEPSAQPFEATAAV